MSISIDLKFAARLLFKKPVFTAVTTLIVAVGLGLTLYTYSLLNSLVFEPLVLNGKNPIVAIEAKFDHSHLSRRRADPLDLKRVKDNVDLFDGFGLYMDGTTLMGPYDGAPTETRGIQKYNSTYVSWNLFEFSGVQPVLGRGFRPEDHHEGAEPTVVISYDVWQEYFNGRESAVGSMIPLDSAETRVIGVMPRGFAFPAVAQIWQLVPQNYIEPTERSYSAAFAFARLKDGVTIADVEKELTQINKSVQETIPERFAWRVRDNGDYLTVQHYKAASITQYYTIFIAMFVVVFLILLLACINVGNLLLARVNERFKEVAIRVALGVPRKRLILQMLWESLFICSIGGFIAVIFAAWGLEVSNQVFDQMYAVNEQKPFWWHVALDIKGVLYLVIAVVLMVFITGYIPAWRALSGDFNAVLRDGTRGAMGKKAARANKVLVISEILLSCVVLIMATIILSTSYSAGVADYGVKTENRLTATVMLPESKYEVRFDTEHQFADSMKRSEFYYQLKDKLEQLPNVEAVAFMTQFPGTGEGTSYFEIEGRAAAVYNENPYSNNEVTSRDSWRAIGMKVLQGRDFDHRDVGEGIRSIIINESIARDFFPDGDAVGQRVRRAGRDRTGEWNTIIGVVSDTFHGSTMRSSSASYNSYHVLDGVPFTWLNMAMHYTGTMAQAERTLQETAKEVDPDVGVFHVQSYDSMIQQPTLLVSAVSKVFLVCGVIALFLAASGIYAVSANSIIQKTQEIGVRRALGSTDSKIMQLFMKQSAWQLLIGLSIGVGTSVWLVNFMTETMMINTSSYVIGLVGVPVLILLMMLTATYLPTRKVVKMQPSEALHHD